MRRYRRGQVLSLTSKQFKFRCEKERGFGAKREHWRPGKEKKYDIIEYKME